MYEINEEVIMSRPFCQDGFKIQKEETPMKKGPPSVDKAKNITVLSVCKL